MFTHRLSRIFIYEVAEYCISFNSGGKIEAEGVSIVIRCTDIFVRMIVFARTSGTMIPVSLRNIIAEVSCTASIIRID